MKISGMREGAVELLLRPREDRVKKKGRRSGDRKESVPTPREEGGLSLQQKFQAAAGKLKARESLARGGRNGRAADTRHGDTRVRQGGGGGSTAPKLNGRHEEEGLSQGVLQSAGGEPKKKKVAIKVEERGPARKSFSFRKNSSEGSEKGYQEGGKKRESA